MTWNRASQARETATRNRPQRPLVAEIHHMDAAVWAHALGRGRERGPPIGDHRKAVGKDRVVERPVEPEEGRRDVLGQAMA